MKTDKNVLPYRWALILVCAAVAGGCLYMVNRSYDPLARYPYADDTERETILAYMDQDDIDYLITQQLQPSVFMEFLTLPEFDVRNTVWYRQAMDTQKEDPETVVHFINRYREVLPLGDLETLLKHYSYAQLASWYELDPTVTLIPDPTAMLALPGKDASVWTYIPADLQQLGSVYLKPEAARSLTELMKEYERVMDDDKLEAEAGYLRFDEAQSLFLDLDEEELLVYPGGQNEQQLGWTAALTGHGDWVRKLKEKLQEPAYKDKPEEAVKDLFDSLDQKEKDRIQWLRDNAWRYGFTIRWPQDGLESTGHVWQPFMIRYVGPEKARQLQETGQTLEENR